MSSDQYSPPQPKNNSKLKALLVNYHCLSLLVIHATEAQKKCQKYTSAKINKELIKNLKIQISPFHRQKFKATENLDWRCKNGQQNLITFNQKKLPQTRSDKPQQSSVPMILTQTFNLSVSYGHDLLTCKCSRCSEKYHKH